MGADNFDTYGFGKTARDAFNTACRDAAYEHGHGGYTGTIAEKSSFRLVDLPKGMNAGDFVTAVSQVFRSPYHGETETELLERFTSRKKDWVEWRKKPYGAHLTKVWRKFSANPSWVALARSTYPTWDDKWGPAVAVEVTGKAAADARERFGSKKYDRKKDAWVSAIPRSVKVFRFFGMASC